jgi:hypothetical protein
MGLDYLPDDQEEFETEDTILWRNNYMVLDCLGAGGMSSDESDVDEVGHLV